MLKIETLTGEWGGADEVDAARFPLVSEKEDTSKGDEQARDRERRRLEAEAIYGTEDELRPVVTEWPGGGKDHSETCYTITKLTAGVKDPNRVNVFLDGHFAFSLDVAQVVELDVKVRQSVDEKRLKVLRDASDFGKLYQRTLEWVLTRPHSVRETEEYLHRRKQKRVQMNRQRAREEKRPLPELQEHTMKLVVERLIEKGYLDDAKFATFYVENRMVRKGISQKRLRLELKRKGVSDEVAKRALDEVERPEADEILKVIKKKRAKYDDYQLVGYLVRQGFDYQKSKDAVENYSPEE